MYGTLVTLKASFGDIEDLILGTITDESLTALLTECSAIIDGYISVVVDLPLESSSAILNNLCISLARAEIYRRYARNDIPENIIKQEANAYKTLEKIQTKKILLVAPAEDAVDYYAESSEPVINSWVD